MCTKEGIRGVMTSCAHCGKQISLTVVVAGTYFCKMDCFTQYHQERNEEDRIRNIVAARRLRDEGGDLPQVLGREG